MPTLLLMNAYKQSSGNERSKREEILQHHVGEKSSSSEGMGCFLCHNLVLRDMPDEKNIKVFCHYHRRCKVQKPSDQSISERIGVRTASKME